MILQGNSIRIPLRDESVHAVCTSFPYWNQRDYGLPPTIWGGDSSCSHIWGETKRIPVGRNDETPEALQRRYEQGHRRSPASKAIGQPTEATTGQFCQLCGAWRGCFGLEPSIGLHVQNAVLVCREIKRVLMKTGVFWLNYGDSYSTGKNGRSAADTKAVGNDDRTFRDKPFSVTELPAKNLCMIPARVAIALQEDGWILRSEIPWVKGNPMPSSVTDRPGTAHEHVFMLVKSSRYYYDGFAVRKSGKEWAGQAGTFNRTNGKNTQLEVPGQTYPSHRERDDRVPAGRALRTSDPFFDSLDSYIAHLQDVRDNGGMLVDTGGVPAALVVNTQSYSAAHYATFPTKLISPLIKTTPEKVCPECGKPWQRMKEPTPEYAAVKESMLGQTHQHRELESVMGKQVGWGKDKARVTAAHVTTGWRPTCKCNLPESACVGAIICDPFAGSGTCGAVARELGRRFIGIDLSARYLAENALPRSEKKMSRSALSQLPMFASLDDEVARRGQAA